MKLLKQIVIAVVGGTVLLIGVAMIILPGPAFIVIPVGLAILAMEFAWARHWLEQAREYLTRRFPGKSSLAKSGPASPPLFLNQKINN
jgi:tellurite resistance protein TerC